MLLAANQSFGELEVLTVVLGVLVLLGLHEVQGTVYWARLWVSE